MNAPCICPMCGQYRAGRLGTVFYWDSGSVKRNGKKIRLTRTEAKFFACLWDRFPRVQTKVAISDWIYDGGFAGDPGIKIVDVWVCKLRRKLRPLGIGIKTEWGMGYALTFKPEEFGPQHAPQATAYQGVA